MIRSIRHAGLTRLFERQDGSKLPQQHLGRIRRALQLLGAASQPADLRGAMRAKPLSVGPWAGYWSLRVTGNWRIVFRFEEGAVHDVDFVDYHGKRKRR